MDPTKNVDSRPFLPQQSSSHHGFTMRISHISQPGRSNLWSEMVKQKARKWMAPPLWYSDHSHSKGHTIHFHIFHPSERCTFTSCQRPITWGLHGGASHHLIHQHRGRWVRDDGPRVGPRHGDLRVLPLSATPIAMQALGRGVGPTGLMGNKLGTVASTH